MGHSEFMCRRVFTPTWTIFTTLSVWMNQIQEDYSPDEIPLEPNYLQKSANLFLPCSSVNVNNWRYIAEVLTWEETPFTLVYSHHISLICLHVPSSDSKTSVCLTVEWSLVWLSTHLHLARSTSGLLCSGLFIQGLTIGSDCLLITQHTAHCVHTVCVCDTLWGDWQWLCLAYCTLCLCREIETEIVKEQWAQCAKNNKMETAQALFFKQWNT